MNVPDLESALRRSGLFRGLGAAELAEVIRDAAHVSFREGDPSRVCGVSENIIIGPEPGGIAVRVRKRKRIVDGMASAEDSKMGGQ